MYNFAQNIKKIFLKMHVSEICVKRIPVNQELHMSKSSFYWFD